jgi:hypothetical protein
MDVYNDQLNLAGDERGIQQYTTLISTGKPFGLSEFSQETTGQGASAWDARTLVNRVYDAYPRTSFAVAWYSATEDGVEYVWALPDLSHTRELLTDPLIYTQRGSRWVARSSCISTARALMAQRRCWCSTSFRSGVACTQLMLCCSQGPSRCDGRIQSRGKILRMAGMVAARRDLTPGVRPMTSVG